MTTTTTTKPEPVKPAIGTRATVNGTPVIFTANGWRRI